MSPTREESARITQEFAQDNVRTSFAEFGARNADQLVSPGPGFTTL